MMPQQPVIGLLTHPHRQTRWKQYQLLQPQPRLVNRKITLFVASCLQGSQQHEAKFQDQVFTKFQDIFQSQEAQHIVNAYCYCLEHKSFMNINNAVITLLERQFYTWNMQVSKTISEFGYRVNKYRESNATNKTVNCSMLLCNKGQYQDILTKWLKFQNNFKFQDTFEISGQQGPLRSIIPVHACCFYAGLPWLTVDHSCLFILLGMA